ncbi:hypothetical protein F4821DRAFT_19301 [Hypoxylon rubiginosum]|uniref:Uncharacterized protein n=1 Tax=Hypoxylon rubiginosum TaxID=110542 RepID=A0ACC0DCY3_9PEZI|nr:hypothetical protein F4821DRAFT_19301 [Hypoxylon rubiginosum]
MANDSDLYLCGLFRRKPRPAPEPTRDNGLQGVEFSPRSSFASSRSPASPPRPAPASATAPSASAAITTSNLNNPEITGYYSPSAPSAAPTPDRSRELRGYYAPEPVATPQPAVRPGKPSYA